MTETMCHRMWLKCLVIVQITTTEHTRTHRGLSLAKLGRCAPYVHHTFNQMCRPTLQDLSMSDSSVTTDRPFQTTQPAHKLLKLKRSWQKLSYTLWIMYHTYALICGANIYEASMPIYCNSWVICSRPGSTNWSHSLSLSHSHTLITTSTLEHTR